MNQEKWYLLLQKDGSFFIDPDQPQEGTWEIYNDWQEAFNAGMKYQADIANEIQFKLKAQLNKGKA